MSRCSAGVEEELKAGPNEGKTMDNDRKKTNRKYTTVLNEIRTWVNRKTQIHITPTKKLTQKPQDCDN